VGGGLQHGGERGVWSTYARRKGLRTRKKHTAVLRWIERGKPREKKVLLTSYRNKVSSHGEQGGKGENPHGVRGGKGNVRSSQPGIGQYQSVREYLALAKEGCEKRKGGRT